MKICIITDDNAGFTQEEARLWDLTLENLGWDKIFISLYLYKYKYKKIDIFFYLCYNF